MQSTLPRLGLALVITFGCPVALPAEADPAESMAIVHVLRPSSRSASMEVAIFSGDATMGTLAGREYLTFRMPPGKHLLRARSSDKDASLVLVAEAGRTYQVELGVDGKGLELALLDGSDEAALEGLRLVESKAEAPFPVPFAEPAAKSEAPAAATPAEEPAKATVVVYRKGKFGGAALNTSVYIDGKETADLDNGTYVKAALPPGRHVLHSDDDDDEIVLDLRPGDEQYILIYIRTGLWKGNGVMKLMDPEEGKAEFQEERADGDLDYAEDVRDWSLLVRE